MHFYRKRSFVKILRVLANFTKSSKFLTYFLHKHCLIGSIIKKQTSGTSSDHEWQRVTTSGTTNDNEWQWMIASGTTSDNEWQRMTTSDNEWQRLVQRVTTNGNEWQRVTISANFSFFQTREEPTTKHPKESSLNFEEDLWRRPIELRPETSP